MKTKNRIRWSYVLWTVLPLAVGGLSALLSMDGMKENALLPQPALQPPAWAFSLAWSILYLLMGVGAGLVWNAVPRGRKDALIPFIGQLVLNFLWSPLFFVWKLRLAAFFVLLGMFALAIWMTVAFRRVRPLAGYLQIPYLLWLCFAGYLNLAGYLING
jgi:tryptophan-rich sensory protein